MKKLTFAASLMAALIGLAGCDNGNDAAPTKEVLRTVRILTVDMQGARYDRLEFTAADGRVHPVSSRVGVPWSTTKGREVTVIYDPEDPGEAVLERWIDLWMPPLILGLAGGMMIVAMAVLASLDALGVIQANL